MWAPTSPDFLHLSDAIFDLAAPSDGWLAGIYRVMRRSLPASEGLIGIGRAGGPTTSSSVAQPAPIDGWSTDPALYLRAVEFLRSQSPTYLQVRHANPIASDWQLFGREVESFRHIRWMRQVGFHDLFGLTSVAADGTFFAGAFLLPDRAAAWPAGLTAEWELAARHLTVATQLRLRPTDAEAILDRDGTLLHGDEATHGERELLRGLVRRLVRSRGRFRDRENPLASRAGGRWVLLDRFESDGRHVVVAHASPLEPRALSARERHVAELLAQGRSHKEIGASLGISLGTVASASHRIYRKLGIEGRVALARALARGRST